MTRKKRVDNRFKCNKTDCEFYKVKGAIRHCTYPADIVDICLYQPSFEEPKFIFYLEKKKRTEAIR